MALKGLILTTWVGWTTGVILLKRPWGVPSFPSWFAFSTLYSLILFAGYCFLMVDSFYNNMKAMHFGEGRRFGKWVLAFAMIQYSTITLLQRLILLVKAKKLGSLMEILSRHKGHEKRKRLSLESILIYLCFIGTFALMGLLGSEFLVKNIDSPSWLSVLGLGRLGYGLFYTLFTFIPLTVVSNCAFAIVLVVSLRVSEVVCDFFHQLKETLSTFASNQSDLEIFTVLHIRSKAELRDTPKMITDVSVKLSREYLISRFEELKDLSKLTDDAISSSAFLIIVGMTLGLVATSSQLFVLGHTGLSLVSDIMKLVTVALHCGLIQVGHQIREMQRSAKTQLLAEYLSLPMTLEKAEIEDVIRNIVEWEWKLSGCGFFVIDRGLASGIFSLVLNYVVILVQLNIALDDPQPPNCSISNTTSGLS